jgi:hypothetical protein
VCESTEFSQILFDLKCQEKEDLRGEAVGEARVAVVVVEEVEEERA